MQKKKLPVGIDDFGKLRREDFYYIDKTGLIRDLLNSWGEVNLFTRPRRFGKTLNMSMLKCFFEIGADKTLFDGLAISKETALCETYMGKHPVIFVSLKGVDGLNFENARDMLQDYLWDSISVRDTAVRTSMKENFYHGMVLGLLRSQGNWLIQSNAETGEGYSDISVSTPARTGIVIELKYANDGDLEMACAEALKQIEEKKYTMGLQRQGMKKIIRYGIAFWEKECMVVMA